jgi:aryl-alcohol dehydrogenase-like predicted oxidoreductase
MKMRSLGESDLEITTLGLGSGALGGAGWPFASGPQDDAESIAAIHKAIDLGINWIDTAAIYGYGHAEEVVGKALKGRSKRPLIFTKCGLHPDEKGGLQRVLKADSIRRELEQSLRRLEAPMIDLYQVHWPNPDMEEAWTTLAELQREGKVRHIGVSNFDVAQMETIRKIAPITSLQSSYSIIDPGIEAEILPYCQEHGIGVIIYWALYCGLLAGAMTAERAANLPADDWRRRHPEFQGSRLERNLRLVEVLRAIGERHGRPARDVAIAWTLRHPAVTGAIVGARSAAQVEGWFGAADLRLNEADLAEINRFLAESSSEAGKPL